MPVSNPYANNNAGQGWEFVTPDEMAQNEATANAARNNPAYLGETGDRMFYAQRQALADINTTRRRTYEQQVREDAARQAQVASDRTSRENLRTTELAKLPGLVSQMNSDLVGQQQYAMQRTNPFIEQRLNALGLLQSGALPEAQAKYQADLDQQRQSALQGFTQDQTARLELYMPQDINEASLSMADQGFNQDIDLQRAALQREFGLTDQASSNQQALMQQATALAEARRQRQAQLWGNAIGAGTQAGIAIGTGGMSLAQQYMARAAMNRGQAVNNAGSGNYRGYDGGAWDPYSRTA